MRDLWSLRRRNAYRKEPELPVKPVNQERERALIAAATKDGQGWPKAAAATSSREVPRTMGPSHKRLVTPGLTER